MTRTPLGRLILFMIGLSIIGSAIAGTHYYFVDLPQHQSVKAPANFGYCNPIIVEAAHRCARTDCNLCLAIAENSLKCEIPASDKIAICGSG
jgi:hypothetical protein